LQKNILKYSAKMYLNELTILYFPQVGQRDAAKAGAPRVQVAKGGVVLGQFLG